MKERNQIEEQEQEFYEEAPGADFAEAPSTVDETTSVFAAQAEAAEAERARLADERAMQLKRREVIESSLMYSLSDINDSFVNATQPGAAQRKENKSE